MEEYVHRVGRTGRAGKTGTSITLWDKADWKHAADLDKTRQSLGREEQIMSFHNVYMNDLK